MVAFASNSLHLIFIFCLYNFYPYTKAQGDPPVNPLSNCNTATNYTHGTPYEQNLNATLSFLVSNGSLNVTTGQNPDVVYGLLQCRRYVSDQFCEACAKTAATKIRQLCPNQKEATLLDTNCTLQYSYQPLSSVVNSNQMIVLINNQNASDPSAFDQHVKKLLQNLTSNAATSSSKLATGSSAYTNIQNIYAMAQCLRYLTESSCSNCLQLMTSQIPYCCAGSVGGRIISTGCNVRYEIYSFVVSLPPPASPPQIASPPSKLPESNLTSNGTTNSTIPSGNKSSDKKPIIVVIPVAVASILFFTIGGCLLWKKSKKEKFDGHHVEDETNTDSLLINLSILKSATRNFSDANKLGQGGFGPVYKGKLPDGRKVAVKRLSSTSGQGLAELRTEVNLVAKLLHRNLVRLLGFCLDEQEKLLVYEYLPNGSLDQILFDRSKKSELEWERRYKIIVGIARGLLYLHEDSQLRIIHRDLKASNILLDENMNPKISDFGLARLFHGSQTQANTNRIAGTYGYMAPEYIKNGNFSIKSDVYSFGVLVLELLAGEKNSNFRNITNIQSYAWHQWSNGTALEIMDPALGNQWPKHEVLKCIHIGLLCVQDAASDRPTMSDIVTMLNSYTVTFPAARRPAFFVPKEGSSDRTMENQGASSQFDQSMSGLPQQSMNGVTITELDPR